MLLASTVAVLVILAEMIWTPGTPAWFVIGILVGDLVGLLLVLSVVLAAIATWKSKARLGRVAGATAALALILCLVGVWVMTAKPS